MAKCVVLLGFSTTGKSSVLSGFEKRIATLDSDQEISRPDGGHIYNVFLNRVQGSDTSPALREIEQREREFLQNMSMIDAPLLLAAGPFLPTRNPEWDGFVRRIEPVCLYLKKSAEEVFEGLMERRNRLQQNVNLANQPGFGCWDNGIITEYRDGRWVLVEREQAINNLNNNMTGPTEAYERLAKETFLTQLLDERERLKEAIREEFGLPVGE